MSTVTAIKPVEVGDFFIESWGYDQTNVDYYEVVRVSPSGKTIWMRHVSNVIVSGDADSSEKVAPMPGGFDMNGDTNSDREGLLQKRLQQTTWRVPDEVTWFVHMTSYSNAYLWDLTPHHQTGANCGH